MFCSNRSGYSVYLSHRSIRLYQPDYRSAPQWVLMDDDDSVILESARLHHHWRHSGSSR